MNLVLYEQIMVIDINFFIYFLLYSMTFQEILTLWDLLKPSKVKDFMLFLGLDHIHVQNGIMGNNIFIYLLFLLLYMCIFISCIYFWFFFSIFICDSCQWITCMVAQHPWDLTKDSKSFIYGNLKLFIFISFLFWLN